MAAVLQQKSMDPLAIVVTVATIYILICILVSFFIDADSTTYLYSKIGPSVSKNLEGLQSKLSYFSYFPNIFKGKVIWIVGASRGLGAAISVSAAARGAKLVLSARTKNDLEKVKTECLDAGRYHEMKTEDVLVLPMDISNTDDNERNVKKVIDKMSKISGVIYCVGNSHNQQWVKTKLETDKELFETCVFGVVQMTRCLLPHMMERNSGMIAVISCVEAFLAAPFMGSVTGCKHVIIDNTSFFKRQEPRLQSYYH